MALTSVVLSSSRRCCYSLQMCSFILGSQLCPKCPWQSQQARAAPQSQSWVGQPRRVRSHGQSLSSMLGKVLSLQLLLEIQTDRKTGREIEGSNWVERWCSRGSMSMVRRHWGQEDKGSLTTGIVLHTKHARMANKKQNLNITEWQAEKLKHQNKRKTSKMSENFFFISLWIVCLKSFRTKHDSRLQVAFLL